MPQRTTTKAAAFHEFCELIIAKDSSIRCAGLANKYGKLIEGTSRINLIPLMNKEDNEHYAIQSVLWASTRETFQKKIGRQRFAIAVYDKLVRATIPIMIDNMIHDNNDEKVGAQNQREREERLEQNSRLYLLISFDSDSNVISIIEKKILPQIAENKHSLFG